MNWDYINAMVKKESLEEFMKAGGLTLGQMIQLLETSTAAMTPQQRSARIAGLVFPHSYRGYYERLAFEEGETSLNEMLACAKSCLGQTFEGYKGGDFTMDAGSMVHVAKYGRSAENSELTIPKLMAILTPASAPAEPPAGEALEAQ